MHHPSPMNDDLKKISESTEDAIQRRCYKPSVRSDFYFNKNHESYLSDKQF